MAIQQNYTQAALPTPKPLSILFSILYLKNVIITVKLARLTHTQGITVSILSCNFHNLCSSWTCVARPPIFLSHVGIQVFVP